MAGKAVAAGDVEVGGGDFAGFDGVQQFQGRVFAGDEQVGDGAPQCG